MSLFVAYKSKYEMDFTVHYYDGYMQHYTWPCETNNKDLLYHALHEQFSILRDFANVKINHIKKLKMLNIK